MKVFVASIIIEYIETYVSQSYQETQTLGVFDSEEKANAAIDAKCEMIGKMKDRYVYDSSVEPFIVT